MLRIGRRDDARSKLAILDLAGTMDTDEDCLTLQIRINKIFHEERYTNFLFTFQRLDFVNHIGISGITALPVLMNRMGCRFATTGYPPDLVNRLIAKVFLPRSGSKKEELHRALKDFLSIYDEEKDAIISFLPKVPSPASRHY